MANAAERDFDEDLAGLESGNVEIGQFERPAEFDQNRGGRLHESVHGRIGRSPISPDGKLTGNPNRDSRDHASTSGITLPKTSVRRKSRPAWR